MSETIRTATNDTPKCPYCGATYAGSHSCQQSPENDYYRGVQMEAQDNGETVAAERKWREESKENAKEFGWDYTPPWEKKDDSRP